MVLYTLCRDVMTVLEQSSNEESDSNGMVCALQDLSSSGIN